MSDKELQPDIHIVGGGFSGIALAANLIRLDSSVRITISRKASDEFGIAYDTSCDSHLLNVPAKGMSAFSADLEHFLHWSRESGMPYEPNDFAPRTVYRRYLQDILAETVSSNRIVIIDHETVDIRHVETGWESEMIDGTKITSNSVVLAFGGFPPVSLNTLEQITGSSAFVGNPWNQPQNALRHGNVGLIGTGLTAVDIVVAYEQSGFEGKYTLISRRGLLPHVHNLAVQPLPQEAIPQPQSSVRTLCKSIRQACIEAERKGSDWRAVIDGMRPKMSAYWMALPEPERKRFIKFLRPFWEVHRHRMPPEVAQSIQKLRAVGRLEIVKGRIEEAKQINQNIELSIASGPTLTFDRLINCSGLASKVSDWPSTLIHRLLSNGTFQTDLLDLGIESDGQGQVLGSSGIAQKGMYVLGHPRRGLLWESTAVPELRNQAYALALALLPVT